jgi:cyanophycinase
MTTSTKGILMLIGGAEDKDGPRRVLQKAVAVSRAQQVAVIPTASAYSYELGREYKAIFEQLGAPSVQSLDIRYRHEADRDEHLAFLQQADLIFFTGGDQVKLVHELRGTRLLEAVKDRHFLHGATIAGTSAGAASASNPLIYDGDDQGFAKGAVKHGEGFGWLPGITVDTHFIERNRIPRLCQFLAGGLSKKGIGVSEDTAAVIYPNHRLEVVGSSTVALFSLEGTRYNSSPQVLKGGMVSIDAVQASFLAHGACFDLQAWEAFSDRHRLLEGLPQQAIA